jgi:hypothetical protein
MIAEDLQEMVPICGSNGQQPTQIIESFSTRYTEKSLVFINATDVINRVLRWPAFIGIGFSQPNLKSIRYEH